MPRTGLDYETFINYQNMYTSSMKLVRTVDLSPPRVFVDNSGKLIKEEGKKEMKVIDDFEKVSLYDESVVQEMISKVNKIELTKLLSLRVDFEQAKKIVDEILYKWAINKSHLYKILGNKLKVKKCKKINVDSNEIKSRIQEVKSEFVQYKHFLEALKTQEIIENKFHIELNLNSSYRLNFSSSSSGERKWLKEIGANDGMKVTKLCHKLYNNEALNTALSKVMQEKEVDMYFYVSIDPIDILTASINKSGWRSCHNFIDGQYKDATLVFLYDNSSLIGYSTSTGKLSKLTSKKILCANKNWRQMISFDHVTLGQLYNRQYPNNQNYNSDSKSRIIRDMFTETICEHFSIKNMWKKRRPNKSDVEETFGSKFYNDVGVGNTSDSYVLRRSKFESIMPCFRIGENNENKFLNLSGKLSKSSANNGCFTYEGYTSAVVSDGSRIYYDTTQPVYVLASDLVATSLEISDRERISNRITELRKLERREHNYMALQNIRREISDLGRELRLLN